MGKLGRKRRETLGCEHCLETPSERDELPFWELRSLYEGAHEYFRLLSCFRCQTRFLEQLHEIINWSGGVDDVWSYWLPLTQEEFFKIEYLYPRGVKTRVKLDYLYNLMHSRPRLTQSPENEFYWDAEAVSPGDIMLPFT